MWPYFVQIFLPIAQPGLRFDSFRQYFIFVVLDRKRDNVADHYSKFDLSSTDVNETKDWKRETFFRNSKSDLPVKFFMVCQVPYGIIDLDQRRFCANEDRVQR
jgi:hypothetical protein